jgi:L-rhamnose isomerase
MSELIEIATDEKGVELWREPYMYKNLSKPNERFRRNSIDYIVISCVKIANEVNTVVRSLS